MFKFFVFLAFVINTTQLYAKSANEFMNSEQYDKAYRAAYADALNGNSADAFVVGKILLEGLGAAEKDQQMAVRFLEESAEAGNMEAAEYLGRAYDAAEFLPKSNNLAYKYLALAKKLGADNLEELLIEIASNLDGEISQDTCNLYAEDKKNAEYAFKLGMCIENAFLEGSANEFYLKAFDEGMINALIPAMNLAFKVDSEPLYRVFEQLDTFLLDARNSEIKEMTNLLKANELSLFDIAKQEKNDDLSYQLAIYYDEGTLFGKSDKKQALNFYLLAKSQGKSGLNSKIQTLTVAVQGATSKGACKGYNLKDKTNAKNLAICAQKGHIKGSAGEYYLLAFYNGDLNSFISAAEILIDRNNEAYTPAKILNAIPDFRAKANAKQLEEFGALVETKGHSSSDCNEKFDNLNTKVSGDIYSCLLSAEAASVTGDYGSLNAAVTIWKNGYGDVLPNQSHAENLQNIAKNDANADGLVVLAMLEKDPMEHFNRAIEFYKNKRLTSEQVTEALELEFQLFSEGRWSEFTGDRDAEAKIELLLSTADLTKLQPEILAEFLAHLIKNENKLANSEKIKQELDSLEFNLAWANILKDIAFDVAGTFVSPHVETNCEALQLAINNDGLVPTKKLNEAKALLLSQCDIFNISAADLNQLISANADDGFKRLGILLTSDKRPACDLISLYLRNEDLIKQSKENFSFNPKDHIRRCVNEDTSISYLFSTNLLDNGNYSEAFEVSSRGCNGRSHSSCAVAGFIKYYKLLDKNMDNPTAIKEANKFLKVGKENLDGNSTMLYLSINRPSLSKLNPFALLGMSIEEAKMIEDGLREKNFSGMPIVAAESCLATNIIGACRSACKPAENFIKKTSTDKLQKLHGERVIRQQKCKQ